MQVLLRSVCAILVCVCTYNARADEEFRRNLVQMEVSAPQFAHWDLLEDENTSVIAMWAATSPEVNLYDVTKTKLNKISIPHDMEVASISGTKGKLHTLILAKGDQEFNYYYWNSDKPAQVAKLDAVDRRPFLMNGPDDAVYISTFDSAMNLGLENCSCRWLKAGRVAHDSRANTYETADHVYVECPDLEDIRIVAQSGNYVAVRGHIPRQGTGYRVARLTLDPMELSWVTPVQIGCVNDMIAMEDNSYILYGSSECGDNPSTASGLLLKYTAEGDVVAGYGTASGADITSSVISQIAGDYSPQRTVFTAAHRRNDGSFIVAGFDQDETYKNVFLSILDKNGKFVEFGNQLAFPGKVNYQEVNWIYEAGGSMLLGGIFESASGTNAVLDAY